MTQCAICMISVMTVGCILLLCTSSWTCREACSTCQSRWCGLSIPGKNHCCWFNILTVLGNLLIYISNTISLFFNHVSVLIKYRWKNNTPNPPIKRARAGPGQLSSLWPHWLVPGAGCLILSVSRLYLLQFIWRLAFLNNVFMSEFVVPWAKSCTTKKAVC